MRLTIRKIIQTVLLLVCILLIHIFYLAYVGKLEKFDGTWTGTDYGVDRKYGVEREAVSKVDKKTLRSQNVSNLHLREKRNIENHITRSIKIEDLKKNSSYPKRMKEVSTTRRHEYENPNVGRAETELGDVFITVKTTQKYHKERLDLLLETWVLHAWQQTYFFTDTNDAEYSKKTRDHLINTNCSAAHGRKALCCKMSVEYDAYIASEKRWFCHVDDDTYINIPALLKLLQKYDHTQDWYLGKPSLNHPIEIRDMDNPPQKLSFWFATGAGFCISRGLALKMLPFTGGGRMRSVCDKIRLPDDCTIGYIVYHLVKKELTVIKEFHSHLEGLWTIGPSKLANQITFSYSQMGKEWNVVEINGIKSLSDDPTRFKSIHCFLNPYTKGCPDQRR